MKEFFSVKYGSKSTIFPCQPPPPFSPTRFLIHPEFKGFPRKHTSCNWAIWIAHFLENLGPGCPELLYTGIVCRLESKWVTKSLETTTDHRVAARWQCTTGVHFRYLYNLWQTEILKDLLMPRADPVSFWGNFVDNFILTDIVFSCKTLGPLFLPAWTLQCELQRIFLGWTSPLIN